jgi:hypothetical protein
MAAKALSFPAVLLLTRVYEPPQLSVILDNVEPVRQDTKTATTSPDVTAEPKAAVIVVPEKARLLAACTKAGLPAPLTCLGTNVTPLIALITRHSNNILLKNLGFCMLIYMINSLIFIIPYHQKAQVF